MSLNDQNVQLLRTHGHYLKQVIKNNEEGQKIIDKEILLTKSADSKNVSLEAERFASDNDAVVFTVSANYNSMGIVHNVTSAVTALIGWKKA